MHTATIGLGEELLLLAVDDERGTMSAAAAATIGYGLAGALLLDLTLAGRLTTAGQTLVVADATPTGDDLLDDALARIAGARRGRDARHWVGDLSRAVPHLKARLLDRLIRRGILRRDEHRILALFSAPHYPAMDLTTEWQLRHGIRTVVLDGETPDARTAMLLSLVRACNLADAIFTRDERKAARRRLEEIARGETIGTAVVDGVAGMEAAVTAAVIAATSASAACAASSSC